MQRGRSAVQHPLVIAGLGVVLLLVAVGHHAAEVAALNGRRGPLAAFLLDGLSASGLVIGGYWLGTTDLDPLGQRTVFRWSAAGLVLFPLAFGATLFIRLQEGRAVDEPLFPLLVAASLGGIAGLVAGYYDARRRELTEQLEESNERLSAANRQLRASNERLEQFAYAASHDLREPIRMVSSYLQLLEDQYGDEFDEDAREFVDYALDGAERMNAMVESLLTYSRIDQGDPLTPTDVDDVVADALGDLELRIEETHATVTTDDFPEVVADADQLGQLVRNLVSNALQYSGDEPPEIHVGVAEREDGWEFHVADEGIGIDPAYQDTIFEMFEQLEPRGEAGDPGASGIGLAMCDRIVERHGGEIWVDSEPGDGATFYFTLPRREAAADDDSSASASREYEPQEAGGPGQ